MYCLFNMKDPSKYRNTLSAKFVRQTQETIVCWFTILTVSFVKIIQQSAKLFWMREDIWKDGPKSFILKKKEQKNTSYN